MRTGPMSRWTLRAIESYRSKPRRHAGCRFEPSCSEFALDAFRTRRSPVAAVLVALRLLRCNPLATQRMADPVRRTHARRPRANAIPTGLAMLSMTGLLLVLSVGIAQAVGVDGGCTAAVNGRDPATMTAGSPLVVHKGESVGVSGLAPAVVQSLPKEQVSSNTHIEVAVVEGLFDVTSSDHAGHGPNWGGTQNVDDYLKYGSGLYKVTGVADGTPGWHCSGSGYVKLSDGNPLTKPIGGGALALAVLGAGGAVLASRPRMAPAAQYDVAGSATPDRRMDRLSGLGCPFTLAAMFLLGGSGVLSVVPGSSPLAGEPSSAEPARRVWVRGHAVAGAIAGLIFGVGAAVVSQQLAYWPLTVGTAIVFPAACAVLCGLRAWMGRAWKVA